MKLKQKLIYAFSGFLIGNILLIVAFFAYTQFYKNTANVDEINFEQAIHKIESGNIEKVNIKSNVVELDNKDGNKFQARIDATDTARELIFTASENNNVQYVKIEPQSSGWHWLVILNLATFVFLITILAVLIGIFVRLKNNNPMK